MRMVFGLVLVLGLGLAGFAVYMAQSYIGQTQAELARERAAHKPAAPVVPVYVARKKLAYGETLTADDVVAIAWPRNALPGTAFTEMKTKDAKDTRALFVEGSNAKRTILRPIARFEPILVSNVTRPGQSAGITTRLKSGMRAFAIKVDVASGVSGFLKPNDHVDIYWTGQGASTPPGMHGVPVSADVTRLIEAGVTIIAVDQSAQTSHSPSATIARTVTVEASQEQVAVLAQAQATGRLALSLVGNSDTSTVSAIEVNSNRLLGIKAQPAVERMKPKVCTIKQRSGDKVIEVPIPCTN